MHRSSLLLCFLVASLAAACGDSGSGAIDLGVSDASGADDASTGDEDDTATGTSDATPDPSDSSEPTVPDGAATGPTADTAGGSTDEPPPAPVDLLLVMDKSSGFCRSQTTLVRSATELVEALGAVDVRVAVTSRDMACDDEQAGVSMGRFNTTAATALPPSCHESQVRLCASDDDCAGIDCGVYGNCIDPGSWTCQGANMDACTSNPNGSLNTSCVRRCDSDESCQAILGDDAICMKPSGNPADWSCHVPLPTSDCPAELPAFLDATSLDLLPCSMAVGINQLKCASTPAPLAAAWAALDPAGANADQAAAFRRPDAPLVIAVLTDEDDCSAEGAIAEDWLDRCSVIDLHDDPGVTGGPLTDPTDYVAKFQGLATKASDVHFIAMAGDFRPFRADEAAAAASQCPHCPASEATGCSPEWSSGEGAWIPTCPGDDTCTTQAGAALGHSVIADPHPICQCLPEQGVPFDAGTYDDLAHQACVRDRYVQSLLHPRFCHASTSICETVRFGQARWGRRLQQVVEGMADGGHFINHCGDGGMENALVEIGERVMAAVAE